MNNSPVLPSDLDSFLLPTTNNACSWELLQEEWPQSPHFDHHLLSPQIQSLYITDSPNASCSPLDHIHMSSSRSHPPSDPNARCERKRRCYKRAKPAGGGCKKKLIKTQHHQPPADNEFIHVRARRGQATDSHSLAERVRRQKISQRMKVLQTLVPGCHKVTGKARMLDEIINYVQSLQNQVEFLSMKLASVNPIIYDFGMNDPELSIGRPTSEILDGNGMVPHSEQAELAYYGTMQHHIAGQQLYQSTSAFPGPWDYFSAAKSLTNSQFTHKTERYRN